MQTPSAVETARAAGPAMPCEPPLLNTMWRCTPASACATAKKLAPMLSTSSGRAVSRWSAQVTPCGATTRNGPTATANTTRAAPTPFATARRPPRRHSSTSANGISSTG